MAGYMLTKRCPKCGLTISITPEASKIGFVCPECKSFIGEKNNKLSDEELKKLAAVIKGMMRDN